MRKKAVIGIGLGCVLLCIAATVLLLVVGAVWVWQIVEGPENIAISVDVPVQVTKGEPTTIEVQLANTAPEPQMLHSIDISAEYLTGLAVVGSEPAYIEAQTFGEWQSYRFEREIPAGGSLTVRFSGVAVKAGDYSGSIDVCINSGSSCMTLATRTIVDE
jgi:hypothetical protein